jgi:hypothetical protein
MSIGVKVTEQAGVGVVSEGSVAVGVVSTTSVGVLVGILGLDGAIGPAGALNWLGAYNALTPYVHDDAVSSNGSSWVCLVACTGVTPVEGVNWSMIAAAADDWTILDLGSFA